ncbi:MAG: diguanylate cyclase [Nitriliruptor sp.]
MRRTVPPALLLLAGVLAAVDARAIVLVAVAVGLTQLPARWRVRDRPPRRGWLVLAGAAVLLAAGVTTPSAATQLGNAAWIAGVGLPLFAPVTGPLRGPRHAIAVTEAATLGALVAGVVAGAILGGLLPGPVSVPALVAVGLAVAVARVTAASAALAVDGGGDGERWTWIGAVLLAMHAVLQAAPATPVIGRVAAAAAAAGLAAWAIAASDPRPVAATSTARARPATSTPVGSTTTVAIAIGAPVVVALAAATWGALPLAPTVLVCLPVLPASLHLVLLLRERSTSAGAAVRDALTDLPTEPVLADRLERAVARARRDAEQVAVAFLDLDGFKAVNDRYGHDVGDALLREVAQRIRSSVRDVDTVVRRSGDEFLVLLPRVTGRAGVERVARRITQAVAEPIEFGARRIVVGASVGLAMWPEDAVDEAELLHQADAAMYLAKAAAPGDEGLRWCNATATARGRVTSRLRRDLEDATAQGEIGVAVQPVADPATARHIGWYVRPRWCHPQLGTLTARSYLPLLVDPEVARRFDRQVLGRAVAEVGSAPGVLTVPVTAASMSDADLPSVVADLLIAQGRQPAGLRLAVHASVIRGGGEPLRRVLYRLEDVGVRCTVTGLGAESLAWRDLAGLPLAALEIGTAIVRDLRADRSRAVAAAVVATARAWGLEVGAAGVDDRAVLDVVRAVGCDHARGSGVTDATSETALRPAHQGERGPWARTVGALLAGAEELPDGEVDDLLRRLELAT